METESKKLRQLQNAGIDMLKREKMRKEESQTIKISSEVNNRRKISDLINEKLENTKVNISHCKTLFAESVYTNNGLDSCTIGMSIIILKSWNVI